MTLFDPGLQPERTELAWRRTSLSLGVGSLVAVRLLPAVFDDPWWALAGLAGLVVAAVLWTAGRRRYGRVVSALAQGGDRAVLPDGMLLAALAAFVLVVGVLGIAAIAALANG